MKTILPLLYVFILLVAACSHDENLNRDPYASYEASFVATVEKSMTNNSYVADDMAITWSAEDAIQVYGMTDAGSTCTFREDTQSPAGAFRGYILGEPTYAFYPASAASPGGLQSQTIAIENQLQRGNDNTDHLKNHMFLLGECELNKSSFTDDVTMKHQTSQIKFNLTTLNWFAENPKRLTFRTIGYVESFIDEKHVYNPTTANTIMTDRVVLGLMNIDAVPYGSIYSTMDVYMSLIPTELKDVDLLIELVSLTPDGKEIVSTDTIFRTEPLFKNDSVNFDDTFIKAGGLYSITSMMSNPGHYKEGGSYRLGYNDDSVISEWMGDEQHLYLSQDTYLESHITSIGDYAFHNLNNLEAITLPSGVTHIGMSAFTGCSNVEYINLPDVLTDIGVRAFSSCSSLRYMAIPDGVTHIAFGQFENCVDLAEVSLPAGLESIGDYAFAVCESLEEISLPNGLTTISDGAFWGCSGLTEITVPSSVTTLGTVAFSTCTNLTSITLPSGLTNFPDGLFLDCTKLSTITVPAGVTSIGNWAFGDCIALARVDCRATTPPTIYENTFENCSAVIHVPASALAAYQSAEYWQDLTIVGDL